MEIITGTFLPEGYECVGTVCATGFDRAVFDNNQILHAELDEAFNIAKKEMKQRANVLGADKIIDCQFSVEKSMMAPVNMDFSRTSYPAYSVYAFGTAVKKK